MNKKQVSILFLLVFYAVIGFTAAALLFFMGTGKKQKAAFSPATIEAAEKEHIVEEKIAPEVVMEEKEPMLYYKVITTNRFTPLNVRVAPGLSSNIIGKLPPASTGYVLEKGEKWSKIKTNTQEGYCSNDYLSFEEISKEEFPYH